MAKSGKAIQWELKATRLVRKEGGNRSADFVVVEAGVERSEKNEYKADGYGHFDHIAHRHRAIQPHERDRRLVYVGRRSDQHRRRLGACILYRLRVSEIEFQRNNSAVYALPGGSRFIRSGSAGPLRSP